MNNYLFIDAVSYLDADLLAEHLDRKDKLKKRSRFKRKEYFFRWIAAIACFAIVLVAVPLVMNEIIPRNLGEMGEYTISLSEVVYNGQRIESNEVNSYLENYENEILSYVSKKEKVDVETLRLSYNGIYHVTVTEKSNFVNYDVITFFVVDESEVIVSSVDLIRDNTSFNYQVNSGGASIKKLNEVLSQNPQTSFALIYIGDFTEAVIAPDNTIYFLNGKEAITEDVDYYSLFNKEINLINSNLLE